MRSLHTILPLLAIFGSIVFPISTLFSRRYIYEPWARTVSVLVSMCGFIWGAGRFILDHGNFSKSTDVVLDDVRRFCCGIGVGLLVAFIIAKPYKKVVDEKSKTIA